MAVLVGFMLGGAAYGFLWRAAISVLQDEPEPLMALAYAALAWVLLGERERWFAYEKPPTEPAPAAPVVRPLR